MRSWSEGVLTQRITVTKLFLCILWFEVWQFLQSWRQNNVLCCDVDIRVSLLGLFVHSCCLFHIKGDDDILAGALSKTARLFYWWAGLQKCTFPGKLVEIPRGLQSWTRSPFYDVADEIVFLKTLHSRALSITAFAQINLDWFSQLASVRIQRVNSCIATVYHATARYPKTTYWRSAKPMEAANLRGEVANSRA